MRAEAELPTGGPPVTVPAYLEEVVAEISQLARRSPHLNQRSGVSVRLTIANYETLVANARRRALRTGEPVAVPRVSDLAALVAVHPGQGRGRGPGGGPRGGGGRPSWSSAAVLAVFRRRVTLDDPSAVVAAFEHRPGGPRRRRPARRRLPGGPGRHARASSRRPGPAGRPEAAESPALLASALEFLLEGLHLTKRLNKDASGARALYRSRK